MSTSIDPGLPSRLDADAAIVSELEALSGPDGVNAAPEDLRFYSEDMLEPGVLPLAIVAPASAAQMAAVVKFARARGIALYPRGGGMSYSGGYVPQRARAVIIDFARLSAIREINVTDGHVTAEAGCTWAELDAALLPHGVRARFWGPMSGRTATLGGSLSNGSVTFGSGEVGASANCVKSFEVVTGTGAILRSGSDGAGAGGPFNRAYGPDLTGIFAHDCGALGFKTAVTLELAPRPALVDGVSFASDDFAAVLDVMRICAQHRLASEIIAMDAEVARQNSGRSSLSSDLRALWRIGANAGGVVNGVQRMARVALAGRGFIDRARYSMHFVIEARDRAEQRGKLAMLRAAAKDCFEIANTVPLGIRAMPFPELPVTHHDGRRMMPIHGVFAWSAAYGFHEAYLALKAQLAGKMQQHGITVAEFFAVVAGAGVLYEPVLYWQDALSTFHEKRTPEALRSHLPRHTADPAARAAVRSIADRMIALMAEHGASHFQVGRLYPYASRHEAGRGDLLRALKTELDPDNICNPGVLGL